MSTPDPHAAALLHVLQTSDALYPTGAYAHSHGLEGMVELGWVTDAASLENYLAESVLPQLIHAELPWVLLAHDAAARTDVRALLDLDQDCQAQRATRELRDASARLGGQRLRLAAVLTGHACLQQLVTELEAGSFTGQAPVVAGAVAACAGAGAQAAATAHAYQAVSGQLGASMKLMRLGQQAVQQIMTRLLPRLATASAEAAQVEREQIGWFAPVCDIASARHESAYTRLFIS
jgi:urease accessory protein